jgi:hypothetical protein
VESFDDEAGEESRISTRLEGLVPDGRTKSWIYNSREELLVVVVNLQESLGVSMC